MAIPLSNLAGLDGKRILVVDDEWLLASDARLALEAHGAVVIGPAPSVADAFAILDSNPIDAAVLDIVLADNVVYPLATHLQQLGIPFVFASSEPAANIPTRFSGYVLSPKPVDLGRLVRALFGSRDD